MGSPNGYDNKPPLPLATIKGIALMTFTRLAEPTMVPNTGTPAQRQRTQRHRPQLHDRGLEPFFHPLWPLVSSWSHRCNISHIQSKCKNFLSFRQGEPTAQCPTEVVGEWVFETWSARVYPIAA